MTGFGANQKVLDALASKTACYTAVVGNEVHHALIGIAVHDEPGYYQTTWTFDKYDDAVKFAEKMNTKLGISEHEAWEIVASSMWPKEIKTKAHETAHMIARSVEIGDRTTRELLSCGCLKCMEALVILGKGQLVPEHKR